MDTTTLLQSTLAANLALHEGGVKFTGLFLRYESLMITTASWVIVQVLQKCLTTVGNSPVFIRLKPLMPVLISMGMAFLPSYELGTWDETLLYGIVLGSLTGFGQKLLKQTVLGLDSRLQPEEEKPEVPALPLAPVEEKRARLKLLREKIKHLIT